MLALALGAGCAAKEAPEPHGGVLPLSQPQAATLKGPELGLEREDRGELPLAGRRVRLVGKLTRTRLASGDELLAVEGDGSRVLLELPGRLDDAQRLSAGDAQWEVIARLDRKLTLPDGREAFSVAPDLVVKTPGPPAGERPSDVVLRLDAADYFGDPGIAPFDAREPLYRLTEVGEPARLPLVFAQLGASGLAIAQDAQGRRFIDHRTIARAADGRERSTRCVFRLDGDHLRNIGFGDVEMRPDGTRIDEHWTDLEHGELYDRLTAKRRPFPPNTYGTPCIGIAIAGFPSERSKLVRFYMSSGAADLVAAYAQREGEESIEARGRTDRALRVRLGVDVRRSAALVDIPDTFRDYAEASTEGWYVGDSTYWLATERPHEVLRYRGLLGPPGTAEVLIERIR